MGDYADPTVNIESLSITRYQDLSTWQLCASDIKSLCKRFLQTGLSVFEFSKRHTIPYSTMKRYVQRYRAWQTTGVDDIRDSKAGRPSIMLMMPKASSTFGHI
jgi:hypothetical protein